MSFCSAAIREKGSEQMFDQPRLPNRPRRLSTYRHLVCLRALHERDKLDSDSKATAALKEEAGTVRSESE